VHDLDAAKDDAGTAERLESKHRSSDALDRPVVLLSDVVEVLTLPNRYRRVMLDIITFDARGVGAALVDRDGCGKLSATQTRVLRDAVAGIYVTLREELKEKTRR
jgi:hypothetical protein